MGIFCYFTIENEQLCEAQNWLMAGYPCTPKTFCRDDVHLFLWAPSTDWIAPLSGNMHLPFWNLSDGAFPYDMGKSPHEPRSKLPTGNCHSLYRHMPFALPAIAVRPTGNCHSPYRQLPFALPAIAIRPTGICRSLTNQGTLDNFLPFPVWAYHINGSSSGSIIKRNTAIREKMD